MTSIENTLDCPAPQFHLGQQVTFRTITNKQGATVEHSGRIVGMEYISHAHYVLGQGRAVVAKENIGWSYTVSTVEGLNFEALVELKDHLLLHEVREGQLKSAANPFDGDQLP